MSFEVKKLIESRRNWFLPLLKLSQSWSLGFRSSWLKSGIFLGDFLANLVNHTQNAEIFTPACKSTVIFAV